MVGGRVGTKPIVILNIYTNIYIEDTVEVCMCKYTNVSRIIPVSYGPIRSMNGG